MGEDNCVHVRLGGRVSHRGLGPIARVSGCENTFSVTQHRNTPRFVEGDPRLYSSRGIYRRVMHHSPVFHDITKGFVAYLSKFQSYVETLEG